MKRLAGVLLVLLPLSMFLSGCGGVKPVENPPTMMKPTEMKMPPDIAKKFGKATPAPGPNAKQ